MSPGAVPPVDPVKIAGGHVGSRIVMRGKVTYINGVNTP